MEENKSKKSVGVPLILVIFILAIALIACIGYIIKNNEKELAINKDNSEKIISELRTEVDNLKNALENKKMTSDEKFQEYIKKLSSEISNLEKGITISGQYSLPTGDSSYYLELDSNHNLSICFTDEKLEKKYGTTKLMTDVIAYYNVFVGQDASRLLCVIKSDGTLWSTTIENVCWDENYKISFEKETKFKNIVSVLSVFGYDAVLPLFVDIDGNIHLNN